mmetsp:Transcript_997/g.3885  ORF Transcript_997/g.3885 Transcript_997/m.3885 type:complete len:209 (-) Transcript_997:4153-4779(-)
MTCGFGGLDCLGGGRGKLAVRLCGLEASSFRQRSSGRIDVTCPQSILKPPDVVHVHFGREADTCVASRRSQQDMLERRALGRIQVARNLRPPACGDVRLRHENSALVGCSSRCARQIPSATWRDAGIFARRFSSLDQVLGDVWADRGTRACRPSITCGEGIGNEHVRDATRTASSCCQRLAGIQNGLLALVPSEQLSDACFAPGAQRA